MQIDSSLFVRPGIWRIHSARLLAWTTSPLMAGLLAEVDFLESHPAGSGIVDRDGSDAGDVDRPESGLGSGGAGCLESGSKDL